MIKKSLLFFSLICFFLLTLWPSIQGKIEGLVTDRSGKPLEKVTVTIISLKVSTRLYKTRTDKNGKFTHVGIWPGYYQVNFKKQGYSPVSREVKVSIAESSKLKITMDEAKEAMARSLSKADKSFLSGNKLLEQKKFAEAVKDYEEAIHLNSTQWGYYFNLGLAYKKLGKKEKALVTFQKALEINPQSFSSNKEIGEILAKSGNFKEAKNYYRKATELSPDDADAFYNLGVCSMNLGESEKALHALLKVVEIKKDYADAYYPIGTLYIGQNKTEEAVEYLEKFLELAPKHEKASLARQLIEYLKKKNTRIKNE